MLEAFHRLNGSAELHVIGGAGNNPENRYMNVLIKRYKADTRIIWHGKIDHSRVNDLITQFDIMIHPSIYLEVFGLNIAESLVMGKPVIATRCGGAEMQVKDGVNGLLVKPNDIQALKHEMMKVIKSTSTH